MKGPIPQYPFRAIVRGGSRVHDMSEWEPGRTRCGRVLARWEFSGLVTTSCPKCLAGRDALEARRLAMNAELQREPHAFDGFCLGGGTLWPPLR
jgi:hypothetical protein